METTIQPQMTNFTVRIPKVDIKRFKGLVKAMGWSFEQAEDEYYESAQFYEDLDNAEKAIANGEGKVVNSIEELNAMFQ